MDELVGSSKKKGIVVGTPKYALRLGANKQNLVEFSEDECNYISAHFELLTEQSLGQESLDPVQFYRGYDSHWSFYERDCDVMRTQTKEVLQWTLSYLEKPTPPSEMQRANPIVLVSSTAGAGKSVMMRRVSLECYKKGHAVAFALPEVIHTRGWDVQRLKYLSQRLKGNKILVVIDNCAGSYSDEGVSMYSMTADLIKALEAETIPAVILLAARSNEFCASHDEHLQQIRSPGRLGVAGEICATRPLIRADKHREFEDKLSDSELIELVARMRKFGAVSADWTDEVYYRRIEAGDKMLLMALYEVTDRALRPFHEIVAEEFLNLREPTREPQTTVQMPTLQGRVPEEVWKGLREMMGLTSAKAVEVDHLVESDDAQKTKNFNLTQRAFLLVSALHQFGLRLPEQYLKRVLQIDWEDFMRRVVHEYALKVIVRDTRVDPPRYQTRHPLIAQTVFANMLTPEEKYELVGSIVEHADCSNYVERTVLYRLLDATELGDIFDPYERINLYNKALKRNQDDTFLLQHLAMLHMKELQDLDKAGELLEASRSLQPENAAIINSIAILEGKRGKRFLQQCEPTEAARHYNYATQLFNQQRKVDPASEYAYHPHALMLFQRASDTVSFSDRLPLFAQALCKLEEGLSNVPYESNLLLVELQTEIFIHLERSGTLSQIRNMTSHEVASNPHAAYILGCYDEHHGRAPKEILDRVEAALSQKPYDRPLLRQKAVWLTRISPEKTDERLRVFSALFHMDPDDVWVARELSYLAFLLDEIGLHNRCKERLRDVHRHPERSVPRMIVDPNTQTPRTYHGTVGEVDESAQRGWILREPYGDRIFFQPFKHRSLQLVTGARVTYTVGINFMGAVAHDIRF